MLHVMGSETKLKPRTYGNAGSPMSSSEEDVAHNDTMRAMEAEFMALEAQCRMPAYAAAHSTEQVPLKSYAGSAGVPPTARIPPHAMPAVKSRYVNGDELGMRRDDSLSRFKPLTLNGTSMTGAVIGGFKLDLEATAALAQKHIRLPPVKLPLIFLDEDLNFNHHFFQGMDILTGRNLLHRLAMQEKYSKDDPVKIFPTLAMLVTSGQQAEDTELTTFVKRVLSVTFGLAPDLRDDSPLDVLIVKSNFYGFQYIEAGMKCTEGDLKMWLQAAYVNYRTTWFNAFKSSGVPEFATAGVQTRYDAQPIPETRMTATHRTSYSGPDEIDSLKQDYKERRRHSERTHRRVPKEEPLAATTVARWIGRARS